MTIRDTHEPVSPDILYLEVILQTEGRHLKSSPTDDDQKRTILDISFYLIFRGETLQDFIDRWHLEVHHEEVSPDMHNNIILLNLVEILQLWETLQEFANRWRLETHINQFHQITYSVVCGGDFTDRGETFEVFADRWWLETYNMLDLFNLQRGDTSRLRQ